MAKLSTEEASLLKAICRNKADDLPRLVYADWLEERGQSNRAEFIRLQIEYATLKQPRGKAAREMMVERELHMAELQSEAREWLKVLPKWSLHPCYGSTLPEFCRGFAFDMQIIAAPFIRYGPQLLDRTPLDAIRLVEVRNMVGEMTRCVWLREIPEIHLSNPLLDPDDYVRLAESEWLVGTRYLELSGHGFDDISARAIANCRYLKELQRLDLSFSSITPIGVRFLADSPYLTETKFILHDCGRLLGHDAEVLELLGTRWNRPRHRSR